MKGTGILYTISAPSGAGKTSLVSALTAKRDDLRVSVSHTTRKMRPGETDGINYHFATEDEFNDMLSRAEFLEHARVFGNLYGTSQVWVEQQLASGTDVILEIDWQGAAQVKQLMPDTQSIFILPPSRQTLLERLNSRGQDDASVIDGRMAQAVEEMSHYIQSDYIIVNDVFETALAQLEAVIVSQRLSSARQSNALEPLLADLLS